MSCDGGAGPDASSSLSSLPGNIRRLKPPSPECELSSTIQWIDLAKSKSLMSQPLSAPFGTGGAEESEYTKKKVRNLDGKLCIEALNLLSGNLMRLNTSSRESTATNGPRKQTGGGSIAQRAARAGGCGNVPPANGCSYGNGFNFGLYGIICEKSGRGSWLTVSSLSIAADFGLNNPVFCRQSEIMILMQLQNGFYTTYV